MIEFVAWRATTLDHESSAFRTRSSVTLAPTKTVPEDEEYSNGLVSFVVFIASSAAYDGLKYRLNSKGRVEPVDLAHLKSELNAPWIIPASGDFSGAETRIAMLLETQYLYGEVEARETPWKQRR